MRYVALASLVVLVGGYVVGQQPAPDSKPTESADNSITVDGAFERVPLKETDPIKIAAAAVAKTFAKPMASEAGPVGRYVPFGNDRLLDTTNGTLYYSNGKEWVVSVEMKFLSYELIDDSKQSDAPVEEPQYEIVDDPDAK